MAENISNTSGAIPKGRAKACTACRQVKLKCDAREVYPQPCTRCRQQSLDCKMDPSFKRVPARRQLEEVSNRLLNLQKSLGLDQNAIMSNPKGAPQLARIDGEGEQSSPSSMNQPSGVSEEGSSPGDHPSPQFSRFLELIDDSEQGSWTLDGLTLHTDQVRPLFRHFSKLLFRHLPILEPCHSFETFYQSSELLFWTIILVSSRLYNKYDAIYLQLVPRHRALLSSHMFGQRMSLKTIHAILLLCTWPYPVSSQYDDLTWMLCGAAMHMAMMMGLHKPSHSHEYGYEHQRIPGTAYIRRITWLAVFATSTSVGSWLGMPPPHCSAQHLETIDTLCRDERLPKGYRAEAAIQRQVALFSTALDTKIDFRTRISLIKMYEPEMDRIQSTFSDSWSDELELSWLAAKIFLVGFAFISNSKDPQTPADTEHRAVAAREMLQHGLSASSKLLSTLSNIRLPHTSRGENKTGCSDYVFQLAFYPKHLFRIGAFANFFLLWFLAVDPNATDADKELARTWVTFTYRLLGAFKHSPEHLRAAKGVELMSRLRPNAAGSNVNDLVINSRLGASIMYSYHFRDCSRPVDDSKEVKDLPMLGIDTIGVVDQDRPYNVNRDGSYGTADTDDGLETFEDEVSRSGGSGVTNLGQHSVRLDDLNIAYGRDTSVSSPDTSSVSAPLQSQFQLGPPQPVQSQSQSYSQIQPGQQPQSYTSTTRGADPQHSLGGTHSTTGLPAGQLPLPTADFTSLLSNAFFQEAGNQDFDFLWQEWDPAVFGSLKMDVDSGIGVRSHESVAEDIL